MKKFVLKVILYVLVFALLDVWFCASRDPFNVMHTRKIRNTGVEPNKNYIKMSYILENPEEFDALLFGSSRVGGIHVEKIKDVRCYNMTYSEGLPTEHLDNLKTLFSAGYVPRRVYVGVDSLSYTTDPKNHLKQPLRSPYEHLKSKPLDFVRLYFDPAVILKSPKLDSVFLSEKSYSEQFYRYGWSTDYGLKISYDYSKATPAIGNNNRMGETLRIIREIVDLCEENGTELILFTNPMYCISHEASLKKDYLVFLEELARIAPFWNFSGYNAVTNDPGSFYDAVHYTAEVGDMMINCMCFGEKYDGLYDEGFGMYVTEKNADELIGLLAAQKYHPNQ